MDWRLRLPGALYRQARDKAGSDAQLATAVRDWLEDYATGQGQLLEDAAQQLGASGGRASAEARTPEERSAKARAAAKARWG